MKIASKNIRFLSLILAVACVTSCSREITESAISEPEIALEDSQKEPEQVGVEVDEWGCRPSAGYQWSKLKLECIRTFEIGIPLVKVKNNNLTRLGFVIFDDLKEHAELFLPELPESILIDLADEIWTDKDNTFTLKKTASGYYELYSAASILLYKSVEKE